MNSVSSLRILHLEDNDADAELIRALLEGEWPACAIRVVQTRADFLDALRATAFDLILSDFSLPQFDGMSALTLAREHEVAAPFIFVSGTIGEENAVRALQNGATDYVLKDRPARLISAVRRALIDVDELRRRQLAEHQLREQAELLDKARDAIVVCDLSRKVTYWNQGAERILGWPADEAVGHGVSDIIGAPALADIESARPATSEQEWRRDVTVRTRPGQTRTLECRVTVIRDTLGNPKSLLLICTDVTEARQLERQFYRSQRLESIGTLAGGMAHDLNNVLTPMMMSVNLIRDRVTDRETLRVVDVLEASAQRGAALIKQVLAYARGAEGDKSELQLKLVVREVVALLSETLPPSIDVNVVMPQGLPPIKADFTQISQVLMNLCVNARDAMPQGGTLTISTETVTVDDAVAAANPGASSGRHVMLSVIDTGTGIPPEIIERIFDPFFTTKGAGKGTGLGLSTTLGIVRNHGGFLQVQSAPGKGSRFSLFFPAIGPSERGPSERMPEPLERGSGETVLVIDDDRNVREIMRGFLEAAGYRTLLAEDGTEGLGTFVKHRDRIRVVITDMMMPGMQGDEVIIALRAIERDMPIILVSGALAMRQPLSRDAEPTYFLAKPMTGAALARAVAHALRSRV